MDNKQPTLAPRNDVESLMSQQVDYARPVSTVPPFARAMAPVVGAVTPQEGVVVSVQRSDVGLSQPIAHAEVVEEEKS